MRANFPRVNEAMWLIDRCTAGKRYEGGDTGHGHQTPANWVMANRVEHHPVKDGELLPHHAPNAQQRFDDRDERREFLHQTPNTPS